MPLPKRYKYKKMQHAAAMGRRNKKQKVPKFIPAPNINGLTVSPDDSSSITSTNKKLLINNLPLTINCKPTIRLKREIKNLHTSTQDDSSKMKTLRKDSGNRLVHWDSLKSMIETNTRCCHCGNKLVLSELTIGIATKLSLTCQNSRCKCRNINNVKKTNIKQNIFSRVDSAEMFAINCQFVLSLMQTGCGATESETYISFLDLPNGSTFKKKIFSRVQNAMRPEIVKISDLCMDDARHEEIKKTIGENLYKDFLQNKLPPSQVPLTVMYDMGWNKRSSGNKYDSMSGHGFLLGGNTRKIMNYRCMSKACVKCRLAELTKKEPIKHECPKNHCGSSKSMECEAIWLMVQDAYYNQRFTCSIIVSDDNSTMKSILKHSWEEKIKAGRMTVDEWPKNNQNRPKKDNGRLPLDIPEPKFLADFNHRVKTVGKAIFALAALPKRDSDVSKELAVRMKSYWGMMLKQVRYLKWEEEKENIKKKMLAPLEHLFNNHKFCDVEWCYVLMAQKEGKPYVPEEHRPLFNKQVDTKMYQQLLQVLERFQTDDNIRDCLHKYDTQMNEGLNMSVSRYVPKFKHYGTTMSLDTRLRCVIGQHNMGYESYYKTLLYNLGCLEEEYDSEYCHISSGIARINKKSFVIGHTNAK